GAFAFAGGRVEQHASLRVHDLLAVTDRAVQPLLVRALDAALADLRGPRIVAPVDPLEIRLADAADVADRVRDGGAVRVEADQRLLDVDAGEMVPAHREARSL